MKKSTIVIIGIIGAAAGLWYLKQRNPNLNIFEGIAGFVTQGAPTVSAQPAAESIVGETADLTNLPGFTGSLAQLDPLAQLLGGYDTAEYDQAMDNAYAAVAANAQPGEAIGWDPEKGYYLMSDEDLMNAWASWY